MIYPRGSQSPKPLDPVRGSPAVATCASTAVDPRHRLPLHHVSLWDGLVRPNETNRWYCSPSYKTKAAVPGALAPARSTNTAWYITLPQPRLRSEATISMPAPRLPRTPGFHGETPAERPRASRRAALMQVTALERPPIVSTQLIQAVALLTHSGLFRYAGLSHQAEVSPQLSSSPS